MTTPQTTTTAQILANSMITVAAVSVFAHALGILMATAPMAAIPRETKATRKGLETLREAFGASVVDKAVKEVGKDDIVELAMKVHELVRTDMVEQYGEHATDVGLKSCPPGDLRCAKEVARTLSLQGVTPTSSVEKVETAVATGTKKARAKAKPVIDTKTNIRYKSESAGAKAVASEYGLDPDDHWAWYKILKEEPERFKKA